MIYLPDSVKPFKARNRNCCLLNGRRHVSEIFPGRFLGEVPGGFFRLPCMKIRALLSRRWDSIEPEGRGVGGGHAGSASPRRHIGKERARLCLLAVHYPSASNRMPSTLPLRLLLKLLTSANMILFQLPGAMPTIHQEKDSRKRRTNGEDAAHQ